jgi:hypothetical protein
MLSLRVKNTWELDSVETYKSVCGFLGYSSARLTTVLCKCLIFYAICGRICRTTAWPW